MYINIYIGFYIYLIIWELLGDLRFFDVFGYFIIFHQRPDDCRSWKRHEAWGRRQASMLLNIYAIQCIFAYYYHIIALSQILSTLQIISHSVCHKSTKWNSDNQHCYKETLAAIMILYRNTKVKVRSPDGNTEYFDMVAGVLQGDTLAPYLFIICLDYVLRTSIDKIRENGFELTKRRSKRYPAKTITDADYADDLALLANTPNQAETLLHSLDRAAAGIGLHVNANKTEYMCYNQTGNIATLDGASLKLVNKFTYLGSSVSSTEKDIDTRLTKALTAIDRLSIIWKSDLTDKMKRSFFQAAVVSILLYGCTTWTLTKRLERRLDGNYTRMLRAVLNKSWRQHPTRLQLYGHLPPITKTIQVRRTRHAGHCWRSKDELISDVLLWTPTHGCARVGRPARTYIQQLCEDTGCNPEDLPEAMNDREKWRETVRDIRAGGATWWWWYIYIYANFMKHNRHFMSTYFLLDPFEFRYYFYRILGELIYVLSIVACIPSTFCPTLGHHQGRIYYKSDVTFVLAYYYYVRASLPLKVLAFVFECDSIFSASS